MNLHSIVSGAVAAVNPFVTAMVQISTGYTTDASGKRTPTYATAAPAQVQIQALQYNDLTQVSGLNIQGTKRAIYLNGAWNGLVRVDKKGGDLITLPDNTIWLVVLVLEHWPDWTKVACCLQDGS